MCTSLPDHDTTARGHTLTHLCRDLPELVVLEDDGPPTLHDVWPGEATAIATAYPARIAEFTATRHLARNALHHLGRHPVAIPTGARRRPIWPAGVVGSMAHCVGYRVCVVAKASLYRRVGVDVEPDVPLPLSIAESISHPGDVCPIELRESRIVFCAKEAAFKAWSIDHSILRFRDIEVYIDGLNLEMALRRDDVMHRMSGIWTGQAGFIRVLALQGN